MKPVTSKKMPEKKELVQTKPLKHPLLYDTEVGVFKPMYRKSPPPSHAPSSQLTVSVGSGRLALLLEIAAVQQLSVGLSDRIVQRSLVVYIGEFQRCLVE